MNPNALRTAGKIQEWASVEQRQKLIQEIEMAMSQSGNPSMRSGLEIEGQIFQRARSKDDYFNLIARFILHLKEVTGTPNNMSNVAQSQKGIIPQVFNIGSSQQGGELLSAYENQDQSSVQQLQTQQAQSQSQLLQAQNSLPLQQQIIQQASSGGTQLPSNVIGSVQNFSGQLINSAAIQSNTPLSLGGQSGTLSFVSGGQRIKQNEIPASVQMPSNLERTSAASLQHLKQLQQRKLQNVQAQRGQPQQLISAAQIMPQHQHRQQQNSQQQQMALRAISSQSQTANQTSATTSQAQFLISTQQQQQHQQQQQQQHQQQQQQQHQQQQQQQQQQHQQQQQKQPQVTVVQPKSQSTPSPQVQQNFQSRPMVSPAGSSIQVARSPLTNQVSPCPPSNSMNNPPSIGPPAQSPLGAVDEVAYADKLKELVKYIEPLGSLINKMSKGEEHAAKRNKLLHIYEVFTNKRRVTLAFLSKCEQVVQTLLSVATPAPSSVSDSAYVAKQSTLQTVTENLVPLASNPMLVTAADHCISPVLKCLSSATIRHPRPPRKRKRVATSTREEKKSCLPTSLQLEMAHLWTKYSFKTDDSLPQQNNFVTLSCKPKNCDVPSVPSIVLRVPANYPKQPPEYTISISDESLLLHSIKRTFLRKLLKSEVDQFQSITRILEAWEQSIQDSKS